MNCQKIQNSMHLGDRVRLKNGTLGTIVGYEDLGEEKPRYAVGYQNVLEEYKTVNVKPEDVESAKSIQGNTMYRFDSKKHIHLLNESALVGTTTMIGEVMPPKLARWGAQCAVDYIKEHYPQVFTFPIETVKVQKLLDAALMAWSKVRDIAAEGGTQLHNELESFVIAQIEGVPYEFENEKVEAFSKWAKQNVKEFIFAEKYTYSKSLWVGGVVDCLARLHNEKLAVIDFKSSKAIYFNHVVQAAGYALQLEESGYGDADGTNWKTLDEPIGTLVVVAFGGKELQSERFDNVDGFKGAFRNLKPVNDLLSAFSRRNK